MHYMLHLCCSSHQINVCIAIRQARDVKNTLVFLTQLNSTGDVGQRVCTAAEMKFYFNSFNEQQNYLKPNLNCNLTSWVEGCEPGWGCSSGDQKINMQDSKTIPLRTLDCRPCCAGFFCPHGLTCMIRKFYESS